MNNFYSFDIGNSHPHVAHFKAGNLTEVYSLGHFLKQVSAPNFPLHYSYAAAIVGKRPQEFDQLTGQFIDLRAHWRGPSFFSMPTQYAMTLGDDRLFSCAYIWQQIKARPHVRALFIDAGTFITFDWINAREGHLGGVINPGLATYLHNYARGENLTHYPPHEVDWHETKELPQDSKSAILTGAEWYFESLILKALSTREVDEIYLTGGSGAIVNDLIASKTKARIEVRPHLIHEAIYTLAQITSN